MCTGKALQKLATDHNFYRQTSSAMCTISALLGTWILSWIVVFGTIPIPMRSTSFKFIQKGSLFGEEFRVSGVIGPYSNYIITDCCHTVKTIRRWLATSFGLNWIARSGLRWMVGWIFCKGDLKIWSSHIEVMYNFKLFLVGFS